MTLFENSSQEVKILRLKNKQTKKFKGLHLFIDKNFINFEHLLMHLNHCQRFYNQSLGANPPLFFFSKCPKTTGQKMPEERNISSWTETNRFAMIYVFY